VQLAIKFNSNFNHNYKHPI